jgi:hypothetical protein
MSIRTTSGWMFGGQSDGLLPVGRDVDDAQVLLAIEGDLERLAERALVVDDEDRDGFAGSPVGLPVPGPGSVPATGHGPADRRAAWARSHASLGQRSPAT